MSRSCDRRRKFVAALVGVALSVGIVASQADASPKKTTGQDRPPAAAPSGAPHERFHVMPAAGQTPGPAHAADASTNLSYGGGEVLHSVRVYVVFWVPRNRTVDAFYKSHLRVFLNDLSGSPTAHTVTQYADHSGPATPTFSVGGVWTDTRAYPTAATAAHPLLDSDLDAETSHARVHNGWPMPGPTAIYVIATARGAATCTDASKSMCSTRSPYQYCAYHGAADGGTVYRIALPDVGGTSGCSVGSNPPNNAEADGQFDAMSHELFETLTDPVYGAGWIDEIGNENGDKCNHNSHNVRLNGRAYRIQSEWSNRSGSCATSYRAMDDPRAVRPGFDGLIVDPNDDLSANSTDIGFAMKLGANTYSSVFVNNNGNVTFDGPMSTYTPFDLGGATSTAIVAPFFADVDTRPYASAPASFGTSTVDGHRAFGITWSGVCYYDERCDKLNHFQVVFIDRSDIAPGDVDIEFNYDQILWETGDASDGMYGLGGEPAVAGISLGTGDARELSGSGVGGAFEDWGSSPLIQGSGTRGRWSFQIRDGHFAA